MGIRTLRRAVFLDRDGILNPNILNPKTGQMESPHDPKTFVLYPNVPADLRRLQKTGYSLFLVSNQPSYAKGKTSLENIQAIARMLQTEMATEGIIFAAYYYCFHHPEGMVPGYSRICQCRKPSPFFLQQAEKDYGILLNSSWMVGDRDTDIMCGRDAGTRTILIDSEENSAIRAIPDYSAKNLAEAVDTILAADK